MNDINEVFFDLELQQIRQLPVNPPVSARRMDPLQDLSDNEFKRNFRFDKESVRRLVNLIRADISYTSRRNNPLTPELQMCIALVHYSGSGFQRITALCGGVSQPSAWRAIKRVTGALCNLKADYIKMPSNEEMRDTAQRILEKFDLPRFAFAIDGMMVVFDGAPRHLPPGIALQKFWCRKQFYAINCQVIANDEKVIYDVDCDWPGSAHDARIWRRSLAKQYLEQQRLYLLAGDSAYPISENLMKPYTNAEAGQDASKRLFNKRLCGLRTVMSENVYGVWKKRFPILREMRNWYPLAKEVIIATAILHNIAILWKDEEPVELGINVAAHLPAAVRNRAPRGRDAGDVITRLRGQQLREMLRANMPPPRRRNHARQ
jgi:hypothetical protein